MKTHTHTQTLTFVFSYKRESSDFCTFNITMTTTNTACSPHARWGFKNSVWDRDQPHFSEAEAELQSWWTWRSRETDPGIMAQASRPRACCLSAQARATCHDQRLWTRPDGTVTSPSMSWPADKRCSMCFQHQSWCVLGFKSSLVNLVISHISLEL